MFNENRHRTPSRTGRRRQRSLYGPPRAGRRPRPDAGLPHSAAAPTRTHAARHPRSGCIPDATAPPLLRRKQPARHPAGTHPPDRRGARRPRTLPAPHRQLGDLRHHGLRHEDARPRPCGGPAPHLRMAREPAHLYRPVRGHRPAGTLPRRKIRHAPPRPADRPAERRVLRRHGRGMGFQRGARQAFRTNAALLHPTAARPPGAQQGVAEGSRKSPHRRRPQNDPATSQIPTFPALWKPTDPTTRRR